MPAKSLIVLTPHYKLPASFTQGPIDKVYHFCYTPIMPTINPRVNVVLEKPLFLSLKKLAVHDGVSLSTKVRDLIREALEEYEEAFLVNFAAQRAKTFKRSKALTHEQVWK